MRTESSQGLGVQNLIVMPAGLSTATSSRVTDDQDSRLRRVVVTHRQDDARFAVRSHLLPPRVLLAVSVPRRSSTPKVLRVVRPALRLVFYCDTAQHTIAGVDPVALYERLHDRCGGFHLKDTHHVDRTGD